MHVKLLFLSKIILYKNKHSMLGQLNIFLIILCICLCKYFVANNTLCQSLELLNYVWDLKNVS